MKKIITLFVLGGLIAPFGTAGANPSAGAEMKVAVVDLQRAINETRDGKSAEQSLNAAVAERQKKFEILKKELEALRADFEKQRLVLSGKPLEEKRQTLQDKLLEVEKTGVGYEQELARQKGEALQKIVTGLQTVVQEIGQKEKYDFIFEKSQGGMLFSSGAEDITDRVIKAYNGKK